MLCRRGYLVLVLGFMLAILCGSSCELVPLFGAETEQAQLFLMADGGLGIGNDKENPLSKATRNLLYRFNANNARAPSYNVSDPLSSNMNTTLSKIHGLAKAFLERNSPRATRDDYPHRMGQLTIKNGKDVTFKPADSFEELSEGDS